MKLAILEAKQELKRVDHLIYVTLKYTRTVDVLRAILSKLIHSYDVILAGMLSELKEAGKIEVIPVVPALRVKIVEEHFDNDVIKEMVKLYKHLRKLMNMKYKKNQEFRRHVNMELDLESGLFKVYIDTVEDYYHTTQNYVELIDQNFSLWLDKNNSDSEQIENV